MCKVLTSGYWLAVLAVLLLVGELPKVEAGNQVVAWGAGVITNPADSGEYADDVRRFNQTFGIGP